MKNPNLDETMPSRLESGAKNSNGQKPARKRRTWPLWTLLGIFSLLLVAAISAFSGYRSGITLRTEAQSTQEAQQLEDQFNLSLQDIADKQYFRARQRLEYIIQLNPSYPGAADKLAEVLLELNTTATPTAAPTPTLTPTPDTRGVDELFDQAQQDLTNSNWSDTIDTLLTLRKGNPDYKTVQVDDMLFLALRNRGRDKIVKEADLEGGIYDLSLAERFGPLDTEAESFLTWARIYIIGASFWEIDWAQAVNYFSQVAPQLPNLRDGSGLSANERYRLALIGYGDQLMNEDSCNAQEQYQTALSLGNDPDVEEKLNQAALECSGGNEENSQDNNNPPVEEPTNTPEVAPTEAPPTEEAPTEPAPTEPPPADTPVPTAYPGP